MNTNNRLIDELFSLYPANQGPSFSRDAAGRLDKTVVLSGGTVPALREHRATPFAE
ncbi:MAG: hypothetical protein IPN38_17845 [Flavobacteriales bacterium]|nr:hypothetical protein [Flavobacteriales bacterium]